MHPYNDVFVEYVRNKFEILNLILQFLENERNHITQENWEDEPRNLGRYDSSKL